MIHSRLGRSLMLGTGALAAGAIALAAAPSATAAQTPPDDQAARTVQATTTPIPAKDAAGDRGARRGPNAGSPDSRGPNADDPYVGARLPHIEGKDGVLVRSVAADGRADTAAWPRATSSRRLMARRSPIDGRRARSSPPTLQATRSRWSLTATVSR